MKIISLEAYKKAKRIKELLEEKEEFWPAKERLLNYLVEKDKKELRQRLRERMRLQELEEKQPEPPTKKTPI